MCSFFEPGIKPSKNTTNLWQHLKLRHNEAYEESQRQACEEKQRKVEALVPKKNYQHHHQVFDRNTKWNLNDPRKKELDKLIMEMIATDILPYAVVEGPGFQRVLAIAEHRYPQKSDKYFRTKLMGEMYSQVATSLRRKCRKQHCFYH